MKAWDKPNIRKDGLEKQYGDREIHNCPVCHAPVELVRRLDGKADRFEHIIIDNGAIYASQDPHTALRLRKERAGKKSVAIVGMSLTSCALAPYNEQDIEIWGLNEAHLYNFMPRWDRWFQMHKEDYLLKNESMRGKTGHLPWLKEKHGKPIYMLFKYNFVPDSIEYPLGDVTHVLFGNAWRGKKNLKYFTSSFAYMMALAIYEGFERIELYGFDMDMTQEYWQQRCCAEFWIGYALGKGIEIILPDRNRLLLGILYGYNGTDYTRTPDLTEG
jgi:hypothetical protein